MQEDEFGGLDYHVEEPAELLHDRAGFLWLEGIQKFEAAEYASLQE